MSALESRSTWYVEPRGRPALSGEEKFSRARRARELRLRFDYRTQEALADASDGRLTRVYVNRIENAKNALSTLDLQRAYAEALHIPVAELAAYLDGELQLDALVRLRDRAAATGDLSAAVFLRRLEEHDDLRRLLLKHDGRWKLSTVARAIADDTYVRAGEKSPAVGWMSLLDSIEEGRFEVKTGKGSDVLAAVRREAGVRPAIPSGNESKSAKSAKK